jgi:hypothetical protein
MARNDIIANHKRGLINSTIGNGFRGGLTGALVGGGLAALATLATGGLALPLVFGAAAAGGMLFGGLNALGGGLRWGAELVGGVLGMNRKQRGPMNEFNQQQQPQQQQGMGLAEIVTGVIGALVAGQSIKSALGFGNKDKGQSAQAPAQDAGREGMVTMSRADLDSLVSQRVNEAMGRSGQMGAAQPMPAQQSTPAPQQAPAVAPQEPTLEQMVADRPMTEATKAMAEKQAATAQEFAAQREAKAAAPATPAAPEKSASISPEEATQAARDAAAKIGGALTSAGVQSRGGSNTPPPAAAPAIAAGPKQESQGRGA